MEGLGLREVVEYPYRSILSFDVITIEHTGKSCQLCPVNSSIFFYTFIPMIIIYTFVELILCLSLLVSHHDE